MEYITYVLKTATGIEPLIEWLYGKIKDITTRQRIDERMKMVVYGNFGDHKYLSDGVSELRLDFGPGYRVYYGMKSKNEVVFISGGKKFKQQKDINRAIRYWREYEDR